MKEGIIYEAYYIKRLKEKNYSLSTIEGIDVSLKWLWKFLEQINIPDIREITKKDTGYLYFYVSSTPGKYGKTLKSSTVKLVLSRIFGFFKFLETEEYILKNPMEGIEGKRSEAVIPRDVLTAEEISRLFREVNLKTKLGFRDRAMMELLYATGIRKAELINLDVRDIDFGAEQVYIRQGKGGKDRVIPLTKVGIVWLKEYVSKIRPFLLKLDSLDQALFVSRGGGRFSRWTPSRIIMQYARKTGIKKKITTHSFRHTFASHMIKNGAKIRYVQEILGHSKLSTTRIYTKVYVQDLRKAVKMYHPRENELFEGKTIDLPDKKLVKDETKVMLKRIYSV